MHSEIKERFESYQILTITLGLLINMLDGFDILSMSFATNGVKAEWQLNEQALGLLLSAGLVGMAAGSLINGVLADRFGRRRQILVNTAWVGLGMMACAISSSLVMLGLSRFITGLGIGGIIANGAVIVSEYAPTRWRAAILALYATGYSIGATIGGAIVTSLIPNYGWRSAFWLGAGMSFLILPLLWRYLPESIAFLRSQAHTQSNRLQETLHRLGLAEFPERLTQGQLGEASSEGRLSALLSLNTILLWIIFFLTMAGFYFLASWIPRLITLAGLTAKQGLATGVVLNLGGIIGCGGFALLATVIRERRLLFFAQLGSAVTLVMWSIYLSGYTDRLSDVWLWALIVGILSNAAMAGLYAVGPLSYPISVRATGMGAAIGVGRLGAIVAPIVAGGLLDIGWTPDRLLQGCAAIFLIGGLVVLTTRAQKSSLSG